MAALAKSEARDYLLANHAAEPPGRPVGFIGFQLIHPDTELGR